MTKVNTFDKQTIKSVNKQNVFNTFKSKETVSVADIIEQTGLTAVTISSLTKELIEEERIVESHLGTSSGGRKPRIYSLNRNQGYLLLFSVTKHKISLVITNLKNEILIEREKLVKIRSNDQLSQGLNGLVTEYVNQEVLKKVIGISVNVPGIVDYQQQILNYSAPLKVQEFDFKQCFKQLELKEVPVYIFKDVDSLLMGELKKESGKVAYLYCQDGLGLSVYTNNVLMVRENGGLELGHTYLWLNHHKQKAGDVFLTSQILEKYNQESQETEKITSLEQFIARLNKNDQVSFQIKAELQDVLIMLCINVANMFAPDSIIIGGGLTELLDVQEIEKEIKAISLLPYSQKLSLKHSQVTKELGIIGTSQYVLDELVYKTIDI